MTFSEFLFVVVTKVIAQETSGINQVSSTFVCSEGPDKPILIGEKHLKNSIGESLVALQCIHFDFLDTHFWILKNLGFSYFEFKIRLIKLGLSFQKQKFVYLNSQPTNSQSEVPTDSQSGVIIITPKSQLYVEGTVKAFSDLQSCLTDSSWIHLILLIKLFQYKIGKTRLYYFCG